MACHQNPSPITDLMDYSLWEMFQTRAGKREGSNFPRALITYLLTSSAEYNALFFPNVYWRESIYNFPFFPFLLPLILPPRRDILSYWSQFRVRDSIWSDDWPHSFHQTVSQLTFSRVFLRNTANTKKSILSPRFHFIVNLIISRQTLGESGNWLGTWTVNGGTATVGGHLTWDEKNVIPETMYRSPVIYLTSEENRRKPHLEDCGKAVRSIFTLNGVIFSQMGSVGSNSASQRWQKRNFFFVCVHFY